MAWLLRFIVLGAFLVASLASPRRVGKRQDDYMKLLQAASRYDVFHNECEFAEDERQVCAKHTYDESECKLRGCCFQPCPGCGEDVPWCFLAKRMLRSECDVSYEAKDDCGFYGITEIECFLRDCCYRPSALTNDPPCFHGITMRLVDGEKTDTTFSGRVEIQPEDEWGTVCDDNFDQNAAKVVCNAFGYPYSEAKGYAQFGQGTGSILLDGFSCDGSESSLVECTHGAWGSHDCSHSEDAGVLCSMEEIADPYSYEGYEGYIYPDVDPYYYGPDEETDYYEYNNDNDDDEDDNGDDEEVEEDYYEWYRLAGKGKGKGRHGFKGKPSLRSIPKAKILAANSNARRALMSKAKAMKKKWA